MNKEELSLDAFYYKESAVTVSNVLELRDFKFLEEIIAFDTFLKECSLEDFIYVMIQLFKDEYPDAGFLTMRLIEIEDHKRQSNMDVFSGKSKLRKDIQEVRFDYCIDKLKEASYYLDSLVMVFKDTQRVQTLRNICVASLKEKELELTENTITVKDSAIDRIILSSSQLEIRVNPEKVVRY